MENKLFSLDYSVSNEMISEQLNDKVVSDLITKFDELIMAADRFSTKIVSSISFFRFRETRDIIDDIDKIIFNRFKIKTQHVSGSGMGYAIITVPPINLNVIAGDIEDKFKHFKDLLGKDKTVYDDRVEVTERDVKSKKDIKDIFRDEKSVIYHTYISYLKLENTLKSSRVKIDLKKANIENLPKDYNLFLLADFYSLINKYKMTAKELTAILLHEIGHGFTHLEYSYRTVKNTTVLLDTIRDNISNGKTKTDTINLLYKEVLRGEDNLSEYNGTVGAIRFIDKYMRLTLDMNIDDRHSFTDSEQLADQFANRFGLGESLVSSLSKLHHDIPTPPRGPATIILICLMSLVFIVFGLLFIPAIITYTIVYIIMTILLGGNDSRETTYDSKLRRYQRIKNDIIKIIRTTDLDKNTIRNLLTELSSIDNLMSMAKNDISIISKIGDNLMPWNKRASSFKKLEELLEDMSENNLYIASNKLRTLR